MNNLLPAEMSNAAIVSDNGPNDKKAEEMGVPQNFTTKAPNEDAAHGAATTVR